MKEKATSFDIAHLAGVSQSTVSRALNNSPLVNLETRERVQRIAQELNYKVDKNASNLRKQKSSTIALLLFEDPTSDDSMINPFFLAMLGSITRACAKANYDLLVSFQNLEDDWHAEYEDSNKADGIILLGYGNYTDYQTKVAQLESQGTHFVRWGAPDKDHPGVSIGCDNYQGGQSITEHLIGLGKKTFAFIGDNGVLAPEFMARYRGYNDTLQKHNLTANSVQRNAISTEDDGSDAVGSLIECNELPEAIVCASDLIAMGALRALRRANINVPQDVAVVGYDNIAVSAYTTPALSTVQQNTNLAGELLVDTLLRAINNEKVEDYLMPADIIIRQSCGSE
ncbi:LacI family DNA-binding transcriptional regulator [Alteromonas sp.]|uniref:LacI family DNA-binding transcriptional regulator n=1 Tax=Alteromonas sp. TaxID=232 RepID=UPI000B732646|nr:LacI family DNA-binding transcriptional regulator [Alteromonas sp.]MAI36508.1 LacI family transcriptional regulator [Alteromonas sp.]OUX91050.1 MAG: LacI family transcriptional regulator [Alteromonas sp. TMED35]